MVDASSLTLTVRSVKTAVALVGGALIKLDAVVFQGIDQNLHSAGNLTLRVSIFHTQEQNTATLMRHPL